VANSRPGRRIRRFLKERWILISVFLGYRSVVRFALFTLKLILKKNNFIVTNSYTLLTFDAKCVRPVLAETTNCGGVLGRPFLDLVALESMA
jgi:hypothetical protein